MQTASGHRVSFLRRRSAHAAPLSFSLSLKLIVRSPRGCPLGPSPSYSLRRRRRRRRSERRPINLTSRQLMAPCAAYVEREGGEEVRSFLRPIRPRETACNYCPFYHQREEFHFPRSTHVHARNPVARCSNERTDSRPRPPTARTAFILSSEQFA